MIDKDYMRNYMREYRARKGGRRPQPYVPRPPGVAIRDMGERSRMEHARNAAYDPKRDGSVAWRSPQAEIMGEPPVGRSALEQRERQCD